MSIQITDIAAFKACNSAAVNDPDFKIEIGDYYWHVHSQIVSKSSEFFAKMCQGTFKEAHERVVTLHDDNPFMIARMLQFMYCGIYMMDPNQRIITTSDGFPAVFDLINDCCVSPMGGLNPSYTGPSAFSNTEIIAMMYVIADKYMVSDLIKKTQTQMIDAVKLSIHAFPLIVGITGVKALNDKVFWRGMLKPLARSVRKGGPGYKIYKAAIKNNSCIDEVMAECMKEAANHMATETASVLGQAINTAKITISTHEQATLIMSKTIMTAIDAGELATNVFLGRTMKRKLEEVEIAMDDYRKSKKTSGTTNNK